MQTYYYEVRTQEDELLKGTVRASRPSEALNEQSVPDPIMGEVETLKIVDSMLHQE